jgi:hypothetical protein
LCIKRIFALTIAAIIAIPAFAENFLPGRYASPEGPVDSLPSFPGLVFTNYFEFREEGVVLASTMTMDTTVVAAGTYKTQGSTIIVTDSESKITLFDIQNDGSIICRTWPWEDVVFIRIVTKE